ETIESEYDDVGRVRISTSCGYQLAQTLTPGGMPLLLDLDGQISHLAWDASDAEVEHRFASGAHVRTVYDQNRRLAFRELSKAAAPNTREPEWVGRNPNAVFDQAFTWIRGTQLPEQAADNVLGTTSFKHDPLGQILELSNPKFSTETFAYQPDGKVQPQGRACIYAPGGRIDQAGSTRYEYDAAHRVVAKHVVRGDATLKFEFEWNAANLVSAVVLPSGDRYEYVYDCFARRVEKRHHDRDGLLLRVQRTVWDGDARLHDVQESVEGEERTREELLTFAYMPGELNPYAHRKQVGNDNGDWVYHLNDQTGRAQALINSAGQLLTVYEPAAFGELHPLPGAQADTQARFTGHWEDEETGIFYNRFRYYDPEVGRYLSPEPIGLAGGTDVFGYARNRPFDFIDIDGRAGMMATGSGVRGRGSASTEGIPSSRPGLLHPVVEASLARPSLADSHGSPRSPAACAEPRHLSDFLRSREPPPIDPNDIDTVQKHLKDYKVTARQKDNKNKRAPCPNCSQLFANLMAKYGAPDPKNIGEGRPFHNSRRENWTNFSPPPAGRRGRGPGGWPYKSYDQALQTFRDRNG
ncbi:MAG: hypothetical protein KC492_32585, partial [Myxococcales bacterium]|nr:hypothetical protein [Myxococcales bacterium]